MVQLSGAASPLILQARLHRYGSGRPHHVPPVEALGSSSHHHALQVLPGATLAWLLTLHRGPLAPHVLAIFCLPARQVAKLVDILLLLLGRGMGMRGPQGLQVLARLGHGLELRTQILQR